MLNQFKPSTLRARPISVCVLALLPAVALSHLSHAELGEAWRSSFTFFKVVLSYVLLVVIVDTPARLRFFLTWLALLIVGVAVLALL